ncbi:hypothetical protein ABI59_11255 [Acidobacteria bacterium Mor1]|nr:hypothetical protein ABI59_11255 [Acidobacteria bacterium Mor1]
MSKPVVIVGAGLSGLCCALHLTRAGIPCRLLEASDAAGGRVRTDVVDGFRLDRGFQVLQTAYPEARAMLDYDALDLRPFDAGTWVRRDGGFTRLMDPRRHPGSILSGLMASVGSFGDKLRVGKLRKLPLPESSAADRSTLEELRALGFSDSIIDGLFRPWFAGVFLERELETSAAFFRFTYRMFGSGDVAMPAKGMEEIPRQLAGRLPADTLRTGARVESVAADHVRLEGGEQIEASTVVLAVEGPEAARLAGQGFDSPTQRGTACIYFAADTPPLRQPVLVLDGEQSGPVNNLVVPSNVSPELAPAGKALISVSTVGVPDQDDDSLVDASRAQLRGWFGAAVDSWSPLQVYRIPHALPAQPPGSLASGPLRLPSGVWVCGDHREAASIQGAMTSGRRMAEQWIAEQRASA